MQRKIKNIHPAIEAHMPGLTTWRAMPTQHIEWLDPFLFLNHHGHEHFPPNNQGLPFGPHPHRGFETLTYILKGELIHEDTTGYKSRITEGGVQWMTAGSGLLHSETSSEQFRKEGGDMELIQLWLNLPSNLKMTDPNYVGLQSNELVHFKQNDGVLIHLISGEIFDHKGPIDSITNLTMTWVDFEANSEQQFDIAENNEVLFYVVKGEVEVNGQKANTRQLVQFDQSEGSIAVKATKDAQILLGFGEPFNEPIAARGPFVMNTNKELHQAILDFQDGKMGVWPE